MSLSLLRLPLEIRIQIYTHLLVSSTGFVRVTPSPPFDLDQDEDVKRVWTLVPYEPQCIGCAIFTEAPAAIDTSICKVSKQIWSECHDVLWAQNTVIFANDGCLSLLNRLSRGLTGNIQHLCFSCCISRDDINLIPFDLLRDWSRRHSLKSFTILASTQLNFSFRTILSRRAESSLLAVRPVKEYIAVNLNILRHVSEKQYFNHIPERRIQVYSGERNPCPQVDFDYCKKTLNPNDYLRQLSEAFDGELWVDDFLCYKAGVMVKMPFPEDRGLEGSLPNLRI